MKQFFKYMLASTLGTIIGFFFFFFISIFILLGVVGSIMTLKDQPSEITKVKENSILVINLADRLVERKKRSIFDEFEFASMDKEETLEMESFLMALKSAKTDDNIKGVLVKGSVFEGSFATMEMVRKALLDFKESGKFIIAYDEMFTQGAYYIASAANEVYLFKEGMMQLYGLRSEVPFFKRMLDKIGVETLVLKGKKNIYKSAVEPFTRENMSEPSKVQTQRIIDLLWEEMVTNISTSRNITPEEINKYANELTVRKPEDLADLHFMDGVVYYDEVLTNIRAKLGIEESKDIEMIDMDDYAQIAESKIKSDDNNWELHDEIAVIYAVGGIGSGKGDEENIGSETTAEAIRKARLDENVKAIVMRVNSPGGSALASEVIWREVTLARESKPFIVSFGDVAASGGYYISTHADRIFASPSTITGSIGVFGIIPDVRGLVTDKLGINFDGVKTNEHADFGTLQRGFNDAEIALLNEYVDQTYSEFVAKVAEGRHMEITQVDSIARGRVWLGKDAKEIGLIDEFGDLDDAIAYAAEKSGLKEYDLLRLPEQKDPFEQLFLDLSNDARMTVASWVLKGDEAEILKKIEQVKQMQGMQARLMIDIKVN